MGNILILHSGLEGITNSCLEVANRLQQCNHTVYTATIKTRKQKIEFNSLHYIYIKSAIDNFKKGRTKIQLVKTALFSKDSYYDSLYEDLEFSAFDNILESNSIDALLIDMELHEHIMYASHKNIPFLLLSQWFSILKNPYSLPLKSSLFPSTKLFNRLIWMYYFLIGLFKVASHTIYTLGINRRSFIQYLGKRLDYDMNKLQSFYFPLPYCHRDLPMIMMTHPDLEFTSDVASHLTYGYPLVFDKRKEEASKSILSDIAFIKQEKKNSNKKLIVATHTTMKGSKQKGLMNLIEALNQIENTLSVVSVGNEFTEELRNQYLSKGIFIYKSIPLLSVLQQSDLCIHHGGIHTINECIHFKVPMVILSGNKYDQNGCAARVSNYGCGISSFKKYNSSVEIRTYIEKVLFTPTYHSRIAELHDTYQRAKAEKLFEGYVEEYLQLSK